MDWISDQHLRKIAVQEDREGSEKPQCAEENYTLENCMKVKAFEFVQVEMLRFFLLFLSVTGQPVLYTL